MRLPIVLAVLLAGILLLSVPWSVQDARDGYYAHEAVLAPYGPSLLFDGVPAQGGLLIIAPETPYSPAEASAIREFLQDGGRVLLADAHGAGAGLLARLDIGLGLPGHTVYTPAHVEPDTPYMEPRGMGLITLALRGPTIVTGGTPLYVAPQPAWLDLDADQHPDLDEPRGEYAFAAIQDVGDGAIIVAGSPELVTRAEAAPLLEWVAEGGLSIDEGHRRAVDPIGMTELLAGQRPGIVWALAILGATATLFWVFAIRIQKTPRGRPRWGDPVWEELP